MKQILRHFSSFFKYRERELLFFIFFFQIIYVYIWYLRKNPPATRHNNTFYYINILNLWFQNHKNEPSILLNVTNKTYEKNIIFKFCLIKNKNQWLIWINYIHRSFYLLNFNQVSNDLIFFLFCYKQILYMILNKINGLNFTFKIWNLN